MRRHLALPVLSVSLGLALGGLFAGAPAAAATEGAPYRVIRGGRAVIGASEEIGDLVAVDAQVELRGVVRGHVYAVDTSLTVRSSAVVLRSLTMQRGALVVDEGAVLPDGVTIAGTTLRGPGGRAIPARPGRAALGRGGRLIALDVMTASSSTAAARTKRVLAFERFAPAASRTVDELAGWDVGLGLEKVKDEAHPSTLTLAGLARLTLDPGRVEGAFQRGYRGARGAALFSGLKLADEAGAKVVWSELERAVPLDKIERSVRSGLGDGAAWRFERRGRQVLLWQRGPWVFAVETKLAAERAKTVEETRFTDDVLGALASALGALEARPGRPAAAKSTEEGAK